MPKKSSEKKLNSKTLQHPTVIAAVITLVGILLSALVSISAPAKTVPGFLLTLGIGLFFGSLIVLAVSDKTTARKLPNLHKVTWVILAISLLMITTSAIMYYRIPSDKLPPLINPTPQFKPTSTVTLTPTPTKVISSPTAWLLENSTIVAPDVLCSIAVNDYQEVGIENVKRVQFIVKERNSHCSWIIPLNGYDASIKKELMFWVRGEMGGEEFEVGIKDKFTPQGKEPKVSQTAQRDWTQVIISLDEFKFQNSSFYQDFSFLENLSLNFNSVGGGTIYISQLIFMPE